MIKGVQLELIEKCDALGSKDNTKFPRGPQNVEDITTNDIFTYENSCLFNFVKVINGNKDKLEGEDLCRHMLQKIDHLAIMVKYLSV